MYTIQPDLPLMYHASNIRDYSSQCKSQRLLKSQTVSRIILCPVARIKVQSGILVSLKSINNSVLKC